MLLREVQLGQWRSARSADGFDFLGWASSHRRAFSTIFFKHSRSVCFLQLITVVGLFGFVQVKAQAHDCSNVIGKYTCPGKIPNGGRFSIGKRTLDNGMQFFEINGPVKPALASSGLSPVEVLTFFSDKLIADGKPRGFTSPTSGMSYIQSANCRNGVLSARFEESLSRGHYFVKRNWQVDFTSSPGKALDILFRYDIEGSPFPESPQPQLTGIESCSRNP